MRVCNKRFLHGHIMYLALAFIVSACQTIGANDPDTPPPPITEDMDVDEALTAALTYGGDTLEKVKALFTKRKNWPEVNANVERLLLGDIQSLEKLRLINAVNLYQSSTPTANPKIFDRLVTVDNSLANSLGWNLAANLPSKDIAAHMDAELTKRISQGEEKRVIIPQMATALIANQLDSGYSLAKRGLMTKGDDVFAKAMIALNPRLAATDFLDYLALASVEELRQLNQQSVNIYACLIILSHLSRVPAPINHPHFDYLFLYAVSRNKALSDLASAVLETSLPGNNAYLALLLSRLPAWIQVAFIESVKDNVSPKFNRFLAELKAITPHEDVIEEIKELRNL